jgi:hypothetical protein
VGSRTISTKLYTKDAPPETDATSPSTSLQPLQVTDTITGGFRRTWFTKSFVNKGFSDCYLFCFPPSRALTADPRTYRNSAKLPRPCGVPPQPKKRTGARGLPRPTERRQTHVTSLPEVNVTMFSIFGN